MKHVTMLKTVKLTKPSGGSITYSAGALQYLEDDQADAFLADGSAEPYPKPEPQAPEAQPSGDEPDPQE